jgi:hypothetical protein
MDFLKNHGEKVLFVVLVAGLALSAWFILAQRGEFLPVSDVESRQADVQMNTDNVEGMLARLTTDSPSIEVDLGAFTPGIRKVCANPDHAWLIPVDAKNCPFCGTEQTGEGNDSDGDGISDQQELAWGMDPNDEEDIFNDPDGDGFMTSTEFELGSDPTDAGSYPDLIHYLRLSDLDQKSVRFELEGFSEVTEGNYRLQLRWAYPGESAWSRGIVSVGERFGRSNEFVVEKFLEKRTRQPDGRWLDETFADIKVGRKVVKLGRYGEDARGQVTESLATLRLIAGPDWEQEVRVGDSFELDKKPYMVIDILNDSVVVKSDDENSSRTVGRATDDELESLSPPEPQPTIEPGRGVNSRPSEIPEDFDPYFNIR